MEFFIKVNQFEEHQGVERKRNQGTSLNDETVNL